MAKILIVDDISANRRVLVTVLRHHGHIPLEAGDGREALAIVRAEHPDLVIADVLMPVMDGYELVRQLRLDATTSAIPVVFYTAHYGEREARALALSGGVADVLTKPSEAAEVMKVVDRALSRALEKAAPPVGSDLTATYDRDHLQLLTDKLSETADSLRASNTRLRALINIGLELASERNSGHLLQRVCVAARDLFGATYVTLGIVGDSARTLEHVVTCATLGHAGDEPEWIKPGDPLPGILATAVTERRALRGDNPSGAPAALQLPVLHPDIHAFLVVPIASIARLQGWICLVGNEGRTFTEDDEELLMALAGQVGRIHELEYEIAERKRAEESLREERNRAQRYLDTADVILLALDLDGRITLINRKGCKVLGWSEDELLGRDWIETCLPQRIRDASRGKLHQLFRGELPQDEAPILTRAGEERVIEWRNIVQRDGAGTVTGTLSSGADVSERNQAVEAVRAAEERMRFALEAAGVGIWDMDFATGALDWSEILEAQYGLAPGTFGRTFDAYVDLVHPEDREALLETMDRAKRSGEDFSVQHRTLWPDRTTMRWLSGAGRIRLDAAGSPVRGLGISLDVTERHTLEGQYQQAQKMEAMGRLAGGVAHDFNNLLTAILGYCELLMTEIVPSDPRFDDIVEIQKAGISAAALTRQLLTFSRKEIIQPTVLDLNRVVSDIRVMLGRLIGEDVEVVLHLEPLLGKVKADRGQVEQIVMNLAVNARDAMPGGGRLTIETSNVTLDELYTTTHLSVTPGPYVVLTVTDTGAGMTAEVQSRLFEPFFTTKETGKGTGLGLATVHGIVTRNGGTVNVYSEVGRGTAFKVYLPQVDGVCIMPALPPVPSPAHAHGRTVLLVEDAEGLRHLVKRLLERDGYTVLVAANAADALTLFERSESVDVLLTDVVMPGASGPELTERLVERRPGLKVIYMSGYTEEAIIHRGVLNPGIAFLHKPFTSNALGQMIRDVLAR